MEYQNFRNGKSTYTRQVSASQKLNSSVKFLDPSQHNEVKLDFKLFLEARDCELDYFHNLLVTSDREILLHPLYLCFLHRKWDKIKNYHIIRLIFYFIFVVFLSLYVLTGHVANCDKYDEYFQHEDQFIICKNTSLYGQALRDFPIPSNSQWYILLLIIIFELIIHIHGIIVYPNTWEYVKNFENIFEWLIIFLVLSISSVYFDKMKIWQNYLGAFTLLIGWINLMFIFGEFSFFHAYIDMYKQVVKKCLKLCILFGFPLFGSAICFAIIFPYSTTMSNLIQGLIITLSMMTGEINTDLIEEAIPRIGFWIWAQLIFILFLFFITICNMNLVVAVIVGDLEKLEETALLSKVVRRTKMIWNLEMVLKSKKLIWLKKRILVFPNNDYCFIVKKNELPKKIWVSLYELALVNNNNNTHL